MPHKLALNYLRENGLIEPSKRVLESITEEYKRLYLASRKKRRYRTISESFRVSTPLTRKLFRRVREELRISVLDYYDLLLYCKTIENRDIISYLERELGICDKVDIERVKEHLPARNREYLEKI